MTWPAKLRQLLEMSGSTQWSWMSNMEKSRSTDDCRHWRSWMVLYHHLIHPRIGEKREIL